MILKRKENNSVNLLKELDEEVKEKTKQAEFLGSKISTLYEEEENRKKQLRELVRQADEQKQKVESLQSRIGILEEEENKKKSLLSKVFDQLKFKDPSNRR